MINESMLTEGSLTAPKTAGSEEHIFISLDHLEAPAVDTSYYMRIIAVDEFGNAGASSNLAQVQGPVTPEGNNAAIVAGALACLAVVATATVGGILVYRKNRKEKVHPEI